MRVQKIERTDGARDLVGQVGVRAGWERGRVPEVCLR
jgi:hypothetical protein